MRTWRRRSFDDLPVEVRRRLEQLDLGDTTPIDFAHERRPALGNRNLLSVAAGRHGTTRALEFLQRCEEYMGRLEPGPWPPDREAHRAHEVVGSASSGGVEGDSMDAVRRQVASAFGGQCRVSTYRNGADTQRVVVLTSWTSSDDRVAMSTLSVHLAVPSRPTELALWSSRFDDRSPSLLATSAFRAIEAGSVRAGEIYEDAVRDHEPGTTTPHLLWSAPAPWPRLRDDAAITWLLGRPITDAERDERRRS